GGDNFKRDVVKATFDVIQFIGKSKETVLPQLCEFIEDCEFSKLSQLTGHRALFSDNSYIVYQWQDKPVWPGVMFSIKSLDDLDELIVPCGWIKGSIKVADYLVAEAKRLLNNDLNASELVFAMRRCVDVNHLTYSLCTLLFFICVLTLLLTLFCRACNLWRLHATATEVQSVVEDKIGSSQAICVKIDCLSGFVVTFEAYKKVITTKGKTILYSLTMEATLAQVSLEPSTDPLVATEHTSLRPPGRKTDGMAAYMFVIKTKQFPNGRQMILIANNITFQIRSFGLAKDNFVTK
ncbi:hypothetical protein MJO29_016161, partial [Puccinia striiformis f. sp. tritici]